MINDQENLGDGLIKYVSDLIKYPSSAIKKVDSNWERNTNEITFSQSYDDIFSVAAFMFNNLDELNKAKLALKVDYIIGFDTINQKLSTTTVNKKGEKLEVIFADINLKLN